MHKPYGFEMNGKVYRKWQDGQGFIKISYKYLGEGWQQLPLSFWDYSEHKVVEYEPIPYCEASYHHSKNVLGIKVKE